MRRALYIVLSIVGVLIALVAGLFGALQTDYARDRLRLLIAEATAGTATHVQLDAVEGVVPFDVSLAGVRLSDRDGIWLTVDRASVSWSPLALLAGRLQVDELAAGTVELARTPAAEETEEPEPSGPLIPDLPIDIDLRSLAVERLLLAAPILGEPAALSLQASAKLGEIGDGLSASLKLQQLSGQTGAATLDLAYRPDDDFLTLAGAVDEPKGGVLGRLIGLPQGSALHVALDGQGPLEAWQGHMNAQLNGEALLELTASVRGRDARTIAFALAAAPDPLLPADVRPLVAGGVDVTGTLEIEPAVGTVKVSQFSAATAAGALSASGILGLSEPGDLAMTMTLGEPSTFASLVPDLAWSGATVQARLQGTVDRPHVSGEAAVEQLAAASVQIGTSKLSLDASAERGLEQPIAVRAELRAEDIIAPDSRLAPLLADGIQARVAGTADQAGTLVAGELALEAGGVALSGSARAEQWGAAARTADLTLTVPDIATVAGPFGLPGKGAAEIALTLAPAERGEQLDVTGTATALSLGQPMLDRLLGPSPTLHVALEGALRQTMTIKTARLTGAKARLDAHGTTTDRNLDIRFSAAVEDASAIDPILHGQLMLDGTLYGTTDAPSVTAELNSPSLVIADRRLDQLKLSTSAVGLLSTPKIELEGTATLNRLPARIASTISIEGARIAAPNLALSLGKTRITGTLAAADNLVGGQLALSAPDLREVGQLAGTPMSGELSATLELSDAAGRQGARLSATGRRIAAADTLTAASLELKASAEDVLATPTLTLDASLAEPVIAGYPLTKVSLGAKGPLTALQTSLSLTGADLKANAAAEIAQAVSGYRIGLQSLDADVRNIHVESERPAMIEIGSEATRIDDLALALEDGRVRLSGSVSPDTVQLAARMEQVPLSLARAFVPDLPVTGRLDGEAEIGGTPAAPSGRFSISGKDVGASDVPEQQADLRVDGTLQQGRLDVKGSVNPKSGGALAFTANLSSLASDAQLQAQASGTLDLVLVDAFLAGGADRVKGKADLDLSATGRLGAPELRGRLHLTNAGYENLRYGLKLRKIEADVRADGPRIEIASLTATTPGGGQVTGRGEVNLAGGGDVALKLQARNATLLDSDLATATIDSDLAIDGNLASRLNLGGSVKILKADIRVPDNLPPSVQEIEVTEVNAPPQVAARIAARKPPPAQTAIIGLELAVEAPQQIFVRGRGLDAELGGAIHVGGTSDKPEIDGAFRLRRGSLDIAGKRLDFKEGTMTFEGGDQIDPILDLTAVARAQELEVTAKVEGSARAPRITLSSVPTMPEDEILARLLFSKSAGELSAFELLQLAEATAELAGVNTGPGVLDNIRKSTGLDRLSLEETDATAGPSLTAGRYVSEGVYVGVSQGARSGSSAATVEIEVTPNVKVESEIGANAGGKAGINLEWDY